MHGFLLKRLYWICLFIYLFIYLFNLRFRNQKVLKKIGNQETFLSIFESISFVLQDHM